jgi:hypothetical protein
MHAVTGRSCWEGLGTEFFRKDALTLLASDVQYGLWYQSVCMRNLDSHVRTQQHPMISVHVLTHATS